jgi:hypothetical protein
MLHVTPKHRRAGIKYHVYNSSDKLSYYRPRITKHNIKIACETLYRYLQSNEYVTYEGRGQAGRWAQISGIQSSAVVYDLVMIDLAKLWAVRKLTNKHASTMRKAAHKIKVNAFKSIRRVGDKRI